jgi:outer membrane protein TolC
LSQQIDRIIFDVTNIYYNLVRLNKQILATEAIIDLSKERLKIAETRFNVGSGAKTDMLQASIDLNTQEVNLQNIHRQVANNRALINALIKRNINEPFVTKDDQFSIPNIDFAKLSEKLDNQNQQLLIAQQEKMNLLLERKIIQSQRIPSVNLNSNTVLNKNRSSAGFFLTNQTFGPNIGLGVGIPIFNGNINKTQLKVNIVQQKQQDLMMEQTKNLLMRDMLIAFQEYENAVSVAKVEEYNVKLAQENNMISTERFRKLQSNSIELRQAQLSLIEAQDRFINAQFRAQVAATALYFITGEISKQQ